ncbi:uncharacterized protein PV09_00194 [Verruconis gallopava]|uniref:PLC-like phosphodiesterase n=1 Tax=Verruconis gallopava TaxID=253628 RepID=A0A0D2ARE1_9PEZI|nr:uncharacterized protein PV09_00194 [Verruconis gallopava]KIW09273.1 hypothetical protein PV09_00194 [Verruconis gallopava]
MQVFGVLLSLLTFSIQIHAFPLLDRLFSRADPLCNGYAQLCSRKYSDITFVGDHDSAFVGDLPSQNQIKSLSDQLGGGIRFLQSQVHKWDIPDLPGLGDVLAMCHTNCLLEFGGLVQDYLKTVKSFLDANPREVVTLLLTNPDNAPMSDFDAVFKQVGLDKLAFIPSTSPNPLPMASWPTLGDMISQNQRLVVFIDYGANEKLVPYLLDEFNYYWETPFDTTDPNFAQCKIDRANKLDSSGKSSMNIVNHFLDVEIPFTDILIPDREAAGQTNAVSGDGSIGAQASLCKSIYGRYPNVVLIDFFGMGDAIGAQKLLNGL